MKPIHSLPSEGERNRNRRVYSSPLIDYGYLSHKLDGAGSGDRKETSPRSNSDSRGLLREEARISFIVEACFFGVLALVAAISLVECIGSLSEFLRAIA